MSKDISQDCQDTRTADVLNRIRTTESVLLPIPNDVFEKLYLSPKTPTAGRLRQTFGNPTPVSLLGFLTAATPLSMITMGWRGSGGEGGAILTVFIFFGGMVQIFGAIGEWILGNTFSCVLFFTYGTFFIAQGTMLIPSFGVGTLYSPSGDSLEGMETVEFKATVGFYFAILAILTTIYLICSIRTNCCLFVTLLLLVVTFGLFAGVYFESALGNDTAAARLKYTAGGTNLALCIPIWWIFIAQIFEAVDFPVRVPVGDLSSVVMGKTQKARRTGAGAGAEV